MATLDEIKEILRKIAEGKATDRDVDVLRQVNEGEEKITLQFGKQIINLGQGTNNHFGDRIYNKWDKETIEALVKAIQQTKAAQRLRMEESLLDDVKKEVKGRLKKSLFVESAKPINLKKELQPELVNCPWNLDIKIGSNSNQFTSDEPQIIDVFNHDEIGGKLLIIGEPGSGKTTTLLELAQTLVTIAEQQHLKPIPVLLNLASWQAPSQPIRKWIIGEISAKYGKSPKTIEQWLNEQKLLPLLDGLDELESSLHETCIRGINIFLSEVHRPLCLVVCTRKEEYINAKTRLNLNGAVCLLPLSDNQIQSYLQQIQNFPHSHTLIQDTILLNLIRVPLFLNLAIVACQEISLEKWQKIDSSEERLQYLWNTYISKRLIDDNDSKNKKIRVWLTWIAQQLSQESKFGFVVAQLQPSKTLNTNNKKVYIFILIVIILSILELAIDLNTGLEIGLIKNDVPQLIMLISGIIPQLVIAILVVSFLLASSYCFKLLTLIYLPIIQSVSCRLSNPICFPVCISIFLIFTYQISSLTGIIVSYFLILLPFKGNNYKSLDSPHRLAVFSKLFKNIAILTSITTITFCLTLLVFSAFSHLSIHLLIRIVTLGLIIASVNIIQPIEKLIISSKLAIISIAIALVIGLISGVYYQIKSTLINILFPLSITVNQLFLILLGLAFFGRFAWSWPCGFILPPFFLVSALINSFIMKYSLGNAESVWYVGSISGLIFGQITQTILTTITFRGSAILSPEKSNHSNQGIRNSFVNASITGIASGLIIGVISGYTKGISFGLVFWLISGGTACIQHFSLRLVLYWNGYIPWDYTKFLNYATERTILQRVGGSYRFIHSLLQEHFVNMSIKTNNEQ